MRHLVSKAATTSFRTYYADLARTEEVLRTAVWIGRSYDRRG